MESQSSLFAMLEILLQRLRMEGQVAAVFIKLPAAQPDRPPSLGFRRHRILDLIAFHESSVSGCFTEHILCLSAAKFFRSFKGHYNNFSDE